MRIVLVVLKWITMISLVMVPINISAQESTEPLPTTSVISQSASANYIIQFTLGLIVVLLAILVFMWLLRRVSRFQSSAGGVLKILGGLSLGARERVVLIQVGDAQVLLGVAPGRVETLYILSHAASNSSATTGNRQAGEFVQQFTKVLDDKVVTQDQMK